MEPLILARLVHFAATLAAGGTIWFSLLPAAPASSRLERRLRGLTLTALALTIVSGGVWLALVAADILGTPVLEAAFQGSVVTGTRFGQVIAARLLIALALTVLVAWRRARAAQALLALLLVAMPALTGHAGAALGLTGLGVMAGDMAHLVAAAAWLGALPAFVLLLRDREAGPDSVVTATRRFARIALLSVAVLVLSGVINAWHMLNSPWDLAATGYGRLLALKLALFAGMLALAAVNRFRLTPALPATAARIGLIRNTAGEIALGLAVVALVAMLGTLSPAEHTHSDVSPIPEDASFVHIHDPRAMADVMIDPGRVGRADVTIRLWREDMSEFPANALHIALQPPKEAARPASEHVAVRQEDGRWLVNSIDLGQDGIWTVRVTVTPRDGSAIVLDAPIVISR